MPGPGYYENDLQVLKAKKEDKMFVYHEQRFKSVDPKKLYPGPGLYEIPQQLQDQKNKSIIELIDCPAIFGSGTKRFPQLKAPTNVILNN